jgi:signal transduction histidine kinase
MSSSRYKIRVVASRPVHAPGCASPYITPKPGGAELGLYIMQDIVQAHGGQLTVESGEGQGTRFPLTLPRSPAVCPPDER